MRYYLFISHGRAISLNIALGHSGWNDLVNQTIKVDITK